jgi:3-phosphoshikimate 1-carboxyvinyltransferase
MLSGSAAVVTRVSRILGRVRVPGDKSISHRYAMLAAIADGTSHLEGYSTGADCAATLSCLEALGVPIARRAASAGLAIEVQGLGLRGLRAPGHPLDAVNSGTTMRLLSGLAAAHPFRTVIGGDESLSRRPMRRVIEPLSNMGATIAAVDGHPPLTIDGADLQPITYSPSVPSAQVKSAVLLAGLHAHGRTEVVEPTATRDHTERALAAFGVRVDRAGLSVGLEGGQRLRAADLVIPGDISSAVFWLVLAAGRPGSTLEVDGVGLNPTRSAVIDVLRSAGTEIETHIAGSLDAVTGEPVGTIRVRGSAPRPFEIDPTMVPGVIDEIPALAAFAAMTPEGRLTVRGASELRVKESDRIAMLARGFRAIGIRVDEYEDGFTVYGGPPSGGEVDAAGDHRLAMAFAIAGTSAAAPVSIRGAEAVSVSYPGFFNELRRLSEAGDGR